MFFRTGTPSRLLSIVQDLLISDPMDFSLPEKAWGRGKTDKNW
jgi:hypothetical protein